MGGGRAGVRPDHQVTRQVIETFCMSVSVDIQIMMIPVAMSYCKDEVEEPVACVSVGKLFFSDTLSQGRQQIQQFGALLCSMKYPSVSVSCLNFVSNCGKVHLVYIEPSVFRLLLTS